MKLTELTAPELLALGGLVRILVRADGEFSTAEEERMNAVGDELGGREVFWKALSDSSQHFKNDEAIRVAAVAVERSEVRSLFLSVLESIALADTMSPSEENLLSVLRKQWGMND